MRILRTNKCEGSSRVKGVKMSAEQQNAEREEYFKFRFVSFQLDPTLPLCPEDEKLQMRKWVIKSILESEHSYLNILDILMQVSIPSTLQKQL